MSCEVGSKGKDIPALAMKTHRPGECSFLN
jgi:hypothetical protein